VKYDNLILFDWFSVTSKFDSPESLIKLLGMDILSFETIKGARGYQERLYYDGINIHFEGREEVWLEMSGQGCRAFETHGHGDWKILFDAILTDKDKGYNITRLDVSFDDHTGIFDLASMRKEMENGNFVSRFKYWESINSSKGITLYHGSAKSDVRFRIYDKAAERNREADGHWVRFEMQMRDDNATRFLNFMVLQDVGEVFAKTVNNYLRYITDPGSDSNKSRWPTADWWYNFIHVSEKISLYEKPGTEYNIDKLERYVVDQAGAATAAYVKLVGFEKFLHKCLDKLACTRNLAYNDLIRQYAPDWEDPDLDDLVSDRLNYIDLYTGQVLSR